MKRYLLTILAMLGVGISLFAQRGNIKDEARFLTDKMSYELSLNSSQYIDVYEINYDFIYSYQSLLSGMNSGSSRAITLYEDLLAQRNNNLMFVLTSSQWNRYTGIGYFYTPLYRNSSRWSLSVYLTYTNRNYYYYNPPRSYYSYRGYQYDRRHNYYYRDRYRDSYYHNHGRRPVAKPLRPNRRDDYYNRGNYNNNRERTVRENRRYESNSNHHRDKNSYNRGNQGNKRNPSNLPNNGRKENGRQKPNNTNRKESSRVDNQRRSHSTTTNTRRNSTTNSGINSRGSEQRKSSRDNNNRTNRTTRNIVSEAFGPVKRV